MSQKGHPSHPALVHFPITFTAITGGLDAIYYASKLPATSGLVNSVFNSLDKAIQPQAFPVLSYYSTILTILTTLPAIVTGVIQLSPVIQRDGFQSKKAKVGAVHALINDIALFATIYNWWTRSQQVGFAPSSTNVFVSSALALPLTMYSAYLGGSLVYEYGMGFTRGNSKKTQ
ncbi:uncharacterized protein EKO05_0005828 [Ascochyta rabiei]|uniref:Uncharacterized protein n=1 Tax=Didymella rabiei TaxID=5454 RepID=A0A163LUW8_DIDRA|nr:uncharacterized protein EKO05_0005828 [Ascochyta rabiei]KZM28143.1 hypothetical protein ST47_g706 [Ascochyta rabiei]UPX15381.1 hypothetical protein EKO05_0005828 [Ascochyta rabiei]